VIRSVKDFQEPLIERMLSLSVDVRPLTRMQTLAGVDGKRFVDKMSPKTSLGFPLT
jgi:hypothetical protein